MSGARVDKIAQPGKDLLILSLRGSGVNRKLLLSAGAAAPKVHFTHEILENPKMAPMFCMLLRKHLGGGRLLRAEQPGLDRVLRLVFETANELGDRVETSLVCEVMGRHSNIILVDAGGKIIDAVKRVDFAASGLHPRPPRHHLPPPPRPGGEAQPPGGLPPGAGPERRRREGHPPLQGHPGAGPGPLPPGLPGGRPLRLRPRRGHRREPHPRAAGAAGVLLRHHRHRPGGGLRHPHPGPGPPGPEGGLLLPGYPPVPGGLAGGAREELQPAPG